MDKVVFFDFDGVIVDSFERAYLTNQLIWSEMSRDDYRQLYDGNINEAFEGKPGALPGKTAQDYFDLYHPYILEQAMFPGVPNALKAIYARYSLLFIVSSSASRTVEAYLEHHDIRSYFQSLHGTDVHPKKTAKMQSLLDAHKARPADAVIITDTLGDIREAASIGVGSIAVAWGYQNKERLLQGKPHVVVETPEHLPAAIDDYFSRPR